ncbi:Serine/threonine protein kinase [Geodermatophilus pulveris]|uniref:non-specific serine/threonine protein kinase n=1 Tax=Geodermatophilus pulveris TaxID=1564159 RepID=A0A239DTI7_9ACTN|nr:serine/threonine-protein kinase [Geodermatophilus pulveris]SNS35218.1 Serine/threonine protein kinase [Geodermatophilus pulveris]
MPPQSPFLDPGTSFATYEVQSVVGRGGMGVVYRARDVRLERTVALKLLAPEFTAHPNFRARFLRESRLAAAVDHPNIIPIYEAGDADGQLFIAMRYVPGADLRTELDLRTRLDLSEALDLLQQVADALDAAHAAGLVHRDVKPGNVLVADSSRSGHRHAYLTDFGLTRRSSSLSGLTTSGHFLGTLDYVAPEQIRGDPVDGRTDVYSFACVAHTVLVGHPPFAGEDDVALMWAHLTRVPPPVTALRPELGADVDAALAAGLAKSPDERPASCGALVAWLAGRGPAGTALLTPPGRAPAPVEPPVVPPERPVPPSEVSLPPGVPATFAPEGSAPETSAPESGAWLLPVEPSTAGPPAGATRAAPARRDRPPRGRHRRATVLAAAALAVVAVVTGLVLNLGRGGEYAPVAVQGLPYTLEAPADWRVQTYEVGDSSVTVLSPTALTGLFADDPAGMQAAAAAVTEDPGAAVGLAVYHRPRLGGDDPAGQLLAAQAVLPGQDADLRPGDRARAGDLGATAMSGTLGLGDEASLQLRVLAVDSEPRQLLVFFAPPSVFAAHAATFDRVQASLDAAG